DSKGLDSKLAELQSADFISEQNGAAELTYAFKHALTQEVAYRTLLAERRASLHDRVGNAIEVVYAGRLEDHLPDLARHFRLSGNSEKAISYLRFAGEQAN